MIDKSHPRTWTPEKRRQVFQASKIRKGLQQQEGGGRSTTARGPGGIMTHRYPTPDQARSRKEVGTTGVAILDLTDNIVVLEVPKAGIRSRIPMPPMPSTYTVENATHLFYYSLRNEQTMRMLNGWNRLIN